MKMTKDERIRAEQLSAAIEQLMHEPGTRPAGLSPDDAGLLDTARQLARLPALLGAVDPALEQQVMRRVRLGQTLTPRPSRFKLAWAVSAAVIVLLLVTLFTPMGQTAVASFLAVFHLGRTEVSITPVDSPAAPLATAAARGSALRETLSLAEAQARVAFAIRQPAYLPPGYQLREINAYSYPDLPAWVPQPFFVELVYGDDAEREFQLRLYPIMLGEGASTAGLNLESTAIKDARDVDVNGQPGVLLQIGGSRTEALWQEVVWEMDELILALSATGLDEAELLRIARSVR